MSDRKSTDWNTLKVFWRTSLQVDKRTLWLVPLAPLSAIFLSTLAPLFMGKIIASLGRTGAHPNGYLIDFAIVAFVGFVANRYGFAAFLVYQAKMMARLQAMGFAALLRRSVGFHNDNVGGKLVSDAIDFPAGFAQLINSLVVQLVPFTLVLVSGMAIVFTESWILGLVIFAMAAMAVGSGLYENSRRSRQRFARLAASKAVTAHLADSIMNVQTVKTFAHEDTELASHNKLGTIFMNMRSRDWHTVAINGSNRIAALLAMQVVFVIVVLKLVQHDPGLLGIGIFAFSFTITLSNRLFDINNMLRAIEDGFLLAAPMAEILTQEPEVIDHPDAKELKVTKGGVALDDITFHYEGDGKIEQTVFDHLQLTIKPGEKVGLVGPSGGGKSTLTRLLLRFEDLAGGAISIDGQNIAEVTQSSLRRAVSYVPQEPLLFHRPIKENIAYGNPGVSDDAVVKAAKAAHADDFIADLQHGYDTVVGERGVKLSGGQRQRVAIARAILKDAPILILDEATSALDSESEVLIQDALWKLMEKRTAIVIAHRLSTIQHMDRILVLDNGKIVEQGTHKELLNNKGLYAKLWGHQSGGFIEE